MIENFKIPRLNPTSWCDVGKTRRGKWDYPSLLPGQWEQLHVLQYTSASVVRETSVVMTVLRYVFYPVRYSKKMRRADLVMIWMYIIRQYTFWNVVQKMRLIQKVIGFCNVTNSTMITIQIRPWYINIIAGHVLRDRMQPHRPNSQSPAHHMRIDDSVGPTIKSVVSATSALKYALFSVFEIWMVFSAS
ncbi:Hypothetical_protein [Hexamita inflata]|uniref:Hypothetical_protein n=1 Tax=Hexamita inflata TaxID=28002 RepID=A0AA86UVM4_9EUKA|nr:Hypothetical protein HINF_LOCUS57314 [Hexamita inflata]